MTKQALFYLRIMEYVMPLSRDKITKNNNILIQLGIFSQDVKLMCSLQT